jgi:diguanylate cyclase (GGDEF)-like protein
MVAESQATSLIPNLTWGSDDQDEGQRLRRDGKVAGILFTAGGAAALPNTFLHEPAFPWTIYLLTALALLSGATCLLIPWQRLSRRWLHVPAIVATAEVATVTALVDPVYSWYYNLVAVYVAYCFTSRRAIAAHVGLLCAAVFAPALYEPGEARFWLARGLVMVPSLMIAAATVAYLRERFEVEHLAYRKLARIDPLTGVGNYRALREQLTSEIARHRRHHRRFTLLVVDLNDFKRINEERGHLVGDEVLRQVGRVLSESVRAQDVVTRHGGDEFSIVAPETRGREAAALAVRVEQALARAALGEGDLPACTGWAVFPEDGMTPDVLLSAADASLRHDKRELRVTRPSIATSGHAQRAATGS